MKHTKSFKKIDSVFNSFLKHQPGLENVEKIVAIQNKWESIFGITYAKALEFSHFEDQTLHVKCRSSALKSELVMIEDQILKAISRHCKNLQIHKIKYSRY